MMYIHCDLSKTVLSVILPTNTCLSFGWNFSLYIIMISLIFSCHFPSTVLYLGPQVATPREWEKGPAKPVQLRQYGTRIDSAQGTIDKLFWVGAY